MSVSIITVNKIYFKQILLIEHYSNLIMISKKGVLFTAWYIIYIFSLIINIVFSFSTSSQTEDCDIYPTRLSILRISYIVLDTTLLLFIHTPVIFYLMINYGEVVWLSTRTNCAWPKSLFFNLAKIVQILHFIALCIWQGYVVYYIIHYPENCRNKNIQIINLMIGLLVSHIIRFLLAFIMMIVYLIVRKIRPVYYLE